MLRNLVAAFGELMAPLFPRRPQYVAGLNPARGEFPFVWERTYPSTSPGALAQAIGGLLAAQGCRVDSPSASAMVGVCDLVQEARRRRVGKALLGTGVALAVVILLMMVSGVTDRALLEWVMTIDVLVGGFGLVQLRYPPQAGAPRRRRATRAGGWRRACARQRGRRDGRGRHVGRVAERRDGGVARGGRERARDVHRRAAGAGPIPSFPRKRESRAPGSLRAGEEVRE